MDVRLREDQLAWQAKARGFARDVLRPKSLERDGVADPRAAFDWDLIREGSRLGFRTAVVAKEWGGHGIDLTTQALVIMELARGDSAMAKTFSQCWKWSHLIAEFCSPDQKARYLQKFLDDDTFLLGHAATEPLAMKHFSPLSIHSKSGWRLKAVRRGDEWILNGEKCFIANGSVAKLFFVDARTNPEVSIREGGTEFLVPIDTPGLRIGKVFNKRGWRFYQNAELIFEDARVPHANVVGEVNAAYKTRHGTFGDLELSANAVGVCDDALDMAMAAARDRQPDARWFKVNQHVQLKISEMHMLTEALRSFVLRVAGEGDAKTGNHSVNNVLLMNFATDVVQKVTALNLEVLGARGGAMPARAEKLARDAVIWTHLAGDSIQRMKAVRRMKWS